MNNFKTFIDTKDTEKINAFYKAGFYASNIMYIMEKEQEPLRKTKDLEDFNVSVYDTGDLTEYLKANGRGFGTPDPIEKIEGDLEKPMSRIYVYRKNGKIVSSVTVWDEPDGALATENIFTDPKHRGKGYATAVLLTALNDAYKRGVMKARLTVYYTDIEAITMYYKFGYKITRVLQEFRHE